MKCGVDTLVACMECGSRLFSDVTLAYGTGNNGDLNRLAVSGEELVHRFEAGVVGLASAIDLRRRQDCRKAQSYGFWSMLKTLLNLSGVQSIPAICIPPGARLLVQGIPAKLQRECNVLAEAEEAVFTQLTALANTFRHAVRVQNGVEVLLQRLNEGQRIRVLDLSFAEEHKNNTKGTAARD
jgi:hypothetical protein